MLTLLGAARLDYSSPAGCPDARHFRAMVAARLGHDPFTEDGALLLSVALTAQRAGFDATLVLTDAAHRAGERKLAGRAPCADFAESVAVAAALALDPLLAREAKEAAAPEVAREPLPPAVVAPPPVAPAADAPTPPAVQPLRVGVAVGPLGALGIAPTATYGGFVELRLAGPLLSVGIGARLDGPGALAVAQGRGVVYGGAATLTPCITRAWVSGCAVVALGGMRLEGDGLPGASGRTVFSGQAGLLGAFEPQLTEHWSLRLWLSVEVPFTRPSMAFGDQRVWQLSWLTGHLGLGVGYAF
ncbi:MAG: hypothetical protein IPJ65_22950 [Archangiaceae bacterium]|nr:hypothetical protein [Archangiaceae bacterium]